MFPDLCKNKKLNEKLGFNLDFVIFTLFVVLQRLINIENKIVFSGIVISNIITVL